MILFPISRHFGKAFSMLLLSHPATDLTLDCPKRQVVMLADNVNCDLNDYETPIARTYWRRGAIALPELAGSHALC